MCLIEVLFRLLQPFQKLQPNRMSNGLQRVFVVHIYLVYLSITIFISRNIDIKGRGRFSFPGLLWPKKRPLDFSAA
jgi:hypothetical protein